MIPDLMGRSGRGTSPDRPRSDPRWGARWTPRSEVPGFAISTPVCRPFQDIVSGKIQVPLPLGGLDPAQRMAATATPAHRPKGERSCSYPLGITNNCVCPRQTMAPPGQTPGSVLERPSGLHRPREGIRHAASPASFARGSSPAPHPGIARMGSALSQSRRPRDGRKRPSEMVTTRGSSEGERKSEGWTAYRSLAWSKCPGESGRGAPERLETTRGSDPPVSGIARTSGQIEPETSGTAGTGDCACPRTPVVAGVDREICPSAPDALREREEICSSGLDALRERE